jgi:hypothetical protein
MAMALGARGLPHTTFSGAACGGRAGREIVDERSNQNTRRKRRR